MANRTLVGSVLAAAIVLVLVPAFADAETAGTTVTYSEGGHSGRAHVGTDGVWCSGGGQIGSRSYRYECTGVAAVSGVEILLG